MKNVIIAAAALVSVSAFAQGGRSLPSGENDPGLVERIYTAPQGELQFLAGKTSHSVLLRLPTGALAELTELRGPGACDGWMASAKSEALPAGCEFVFRDPVNGAVLDVHAGEMRESSLFQANGAAARGAFVAL